MELTLGQRRDHRDIIVQRVQEVISVVLYGCYVDLTRNNCGVHQLTRYFFGTSRIQGERLPEVCVTTREIGVLGMTCTMVYRCLTLVRGLTLCAYLLRYEGHVLVYNGN